MIKKSIILFCLLLFPVYSYAANELHVGSGQTYSTIASAIAASSDASETTIYVHEGSYSETMLAPKNGISNSQRMVITGVTGEAKPTITASNNSAYVFNIEGPDYITLAYLDITGGNNIAAAVYIGEDSQSNYITVDHCDIDGNSAVDQAAAIWLRKCTYITISNCDLTSSGGTFAMKLYATNEVHNNITITNNLMHDCEGGVGYKWGDNSDRTITIENNIFRDLDNRGIYADQGYLNIENNVFDTCAASMVFGDNWGGDYCTIVHNTIYGSNANNALYFSSYGDNNTATYNIRYSASTVSDFGSNNTYASDFTTDPDFVDAPNGDFTLDTGSGAIGTADAGSDYGADLDLVGIDAGTSSTTTPISSGVGGTYSTGGG